MADDKKPEGVQPSAPPTGANPAATPQQKIGAGRRCARDCCGGGRDGAKPAPAPAARPPAAPRPAAAPIPDLAGRTTNAASPRCGGQSGRQNGYGQGRDTRSGRHVAAADATRLDGSRVGRILGGVGGGARRDRPLHVSECAQRAAAAVQGRLSERVRNGRRRTLEGEVRRLDRPHARRHRRRTRAGSTRCS